ncbi:hypothetical protein T12_8564 [Trichinella patagoniensis]|uniref:Uncharacterized protein n=1 Tax=Trichinella patagoniensis TaxID=990121 RepID=A0A0V0YWA3_9BILA|nr:hypothetical protein T12_8564 [Trichinella patagoniensis]
MEKFPHMSRMPIILGTIQRAVMDTVSFSTDLEGTLEMAVLII